MRLLSLCVKASARFHAGILLVLWDLHQAALYSSLHVCVLNHEVAVLLACYARKNELASLGVLIAHYHFLIHFGGSAIGFLWAHVAELDVEFVWTKEHLALGVLWPPLHVLLGATAVGNSENAATSKTFLLVLGLKIDRSIECMRICSQRWQEIEAQLQLAQVALFSVSMCRIGA